uniref:Uncharacterized protein n=1 Tax=Acrobeloides nanus TaxID=290746 RepID=A0A914DR84_9BILA
MVPLNSIPLDTVTTPTTAFCDQRGKCYCPNTFYNFYVSDGTGTGFDFINYIEVCGYTSLLICPPGKISGVSCVYAGDANGFMVPGSQRICSTTNISIPITCNIDTTVCSTANLEFCNANNGNSGFWTADINGVAYTASNPNSIVCDQTNFYFG